MAEKLPEPWFSFLADIDSFVRQEMHFHCIGGFVVTVVYGANRSTSDLDAISAVQKNVDLLGYAGQGSELHRKYNVYLDPVGVAPLPENYEERLTKIFPATFEHLRLFALDPYDIALTKIERNTERDRDDVKYLAEAASFDLEKLQERYFDELRPFLGNPKREDLTLRLWVEMILEVREGLG